jgi:hypothetical protein
MSLASKEGAMPRFFFDYRDNQGHLERDVDGIAFPSLEAAYQDAVQAAAEMKADACCEGQNVAGHSFEIRDESGRMLLVLPFAEALARRA